MRATTLHLRSSPLTMRTPWARRAQLRSANAPELRVAMREGWVARPLAQPLDMRRAHLAPGIAAEIFVLFLLRREPPECARPLDSSGRYPRARSQERAACTFLPCALRQRTSLFSSSAGFQSRS